jgi:hypothetical protein
MDKLIDRVKKFAEEYAPTKKGVYKGQNNLDIIRKQCYQGKMAEWAVYFYLRKVMNITPKSPPTMMVINNPDFSADLFIDKYKVAVKCCPSWNLNTKNAYSWTFQNGKYRRDDIFNPGHDDKGHIVFFVACLSESVYEIYGTATVQRLKESGAFIFEDGIDKASLKGEKLFVKANKTEAIKEIRKVARF